jgi:hypothetical protein
MERDTICRMFDVKLITCVATLMSRRGGSIWTIRWRSISGAEGREGLDRQHGGRATTRTHQRPMTIKARVDQLHGELARLPLASGDAWTYGVNQDVQGRVDRACLGQAVRRVPRVRFRPLGMKDTG